MAWEIEKIQTMLNSKALCTVTFSFCWLYFWAASRTETCMIVLLRPCLPTLIARLLVTSWQRTALSCWCQSMLYATLRTASFPPVLRVAWLCLTLGLLKPDTAKIYLYSMWVIALLNFMLRNQACKSERLGLLFLISSSCRGWLCCCIPVQNNLCRKTN